MSADTDLLDEIVADVARVQGVVVKRDDPIMAAVLANKAILERYLRQALGTIEKGIAEALARSMTQARQELAEHTQAQLAYIDEVMLKDRERFVAEQQAVLDGMDKQLRNHDKALAQIMTDVLEKVRARVEAEKQVNAAKTPHAPPPTQGSGAALRTLALGALFGAVGVLGLLLAILKLRG